MTVEHRWRMVAEPGAWPLVGRESECRTIEAALVGRNSRGAVLVGDAGVGKTRLIHEALRRHAADGGACESVVATRALTSIPFGAVAPLLPDGLPGRGSPVDVLAAVARRFRAGARGSIGPVVAVDDAHLLDEASAGLLHQLAVRGLVVPLVSVRGGERLCDAVMALRKDGALRLSVGPLPAPAVDTLLDHALGGPVDPISRRRLNRLADGNPLLLRELLADAMETGALVRRDGIWRWRRSVPAGNRLTEAVLSRLGDPGVDGLRVLETIACREPLAMSVLEQVVDVAAIERAERSGAAVAENDHGRVVVRLAHPLYAETLRAALPASRVRAIHTDLLAAHAAAPTGTDDDVLATGVSQLLSGTTHHPSVLLAAARRAGAQYDLGLAERLARAARASGGGVEADLVLAGILHRRDRSNEAIEVLPATPPADRALLAEWAVVRAEVLYWGFGRTGEAERTLLGVPADAPGQELGEAIRSWLLLCEGRCHAALEAAERVLNQPGASDRAVLWTAMSAAAVAGLLGRVGLVDDIAARGRTVADAASDRYPPDRYPWDRARVGYGHCVGLYAAGQLHVARQVAENGYGSAVASDVGGADAVTGVWAALSGLVARAQGRLPEARTALREAVVLLEDIDEYQIVRRILAALAGAAAVAGDAATARTWLARADAHRGPTNCLHEPFIELDRAWVAAANGRMSAAVDLTMHAASLARRRDLPMVEATALYDAARLGAAGSVHARLHALAGEIGGELVPAFACAAGGLARGDAAALGQATAVFGEHGQLLLAAEAAAATAHAHRQAGRHSSARVAVERLAMLAEACPEARTPLLDAQAAGASLSRREREIALLAIRLRSRQIADRLNLSVRTVDNTLARTYTKLGICSRAELAALFGAAGAGAGAARSVKTPAWR